MGCGILQHIFYHSTGRETGVNGGDSNPQQSYHWCWKSTQNLHTSPTFSHFSSHGSLWGRKQQRGWESPEFAVEHPGSSFGCELFPLLQDLRGWGSSRPMSSICKKGNWDDKMRYPIKAVLAETPICRAKQAIGRVGVLYESTLQSVGDYRCWSKKESNCREFSWVYLNQTDSNCQETKSQWIQKMLWGMAALPLFSTLESKEEA